MEREAGEIGGRSVGLGEWTTNQNEGGPVWEVWSDDGENTLGLIDHLPVYPLIIGSVHLHVMSYRVVHNPPVQRPAARISNFKPKTGLTLVALKWIRRRHHHVNRLAC
jgi:hypothetical protein